MARRSRYPSAMQHHHHPSTGTHLSTQPMLKASPCTHSAYMTTSALNANLQPFAPSSSSDMSPPASLTPDRGRRGRPQCPLSTCCLSLKLPPDGRSQGARPWHLSEHLLQPRTEITSGLGTTRHCSLHPVWHHTVYAKGNFIPVCARETLPRRGEGGEPTMARKTSYLKRNKMFY